MKRLLPLLLLLLASEMQAQVSFGKAERLNDDWRFLRADSSWNVSESPEMKAPAFDDSRWRRVTLPHDWGVELPMSPDKGSCQGYLPGGIGWYRKHLSNLNSQLSNLKPQTKYFVYFEGVYNHSEVYLNGHLLGKRPSGFSSFLYHIREWVRRFLTLRLF